MRGTFLVQDSELRDGSSSKSPSDGIRRWKSNVSMWTPSNWFGERFIFWTLLKILLNPRFSLVGSLSFGLFPVCAGMRFEMTASEPSVAHVTGHLANKLVVECRSFSCLLFRLLLWLPFFASLVKFWSLCTI